ncbi:uncharacterized protein LOC111000265 isoform X3 [Pieris rapae]|uniref:uncharacterized protein LOC111000265 isoform X2 n=1 Tax=Pieris rapae TaxID=64459 RepID=UPI001E27EE1F|nr:uncharacterized protein LOC111000265 isoform X2 [Pieris rapae]XP_045483979.1 uncharacterized protein LOC111000265 isoform X3 [Pieris rapae]
MTRETDKAFYVVQFKDKPFESIDEYVCVPYTWMIVSRLMTGMVIVAYPNEEDPFYTRDRVKREERRNKKWKFYFATVKNKSYSYNDAQSWIALVKEESKVTDKQPKFPVNKELRSAYQPKRSRPTKMERNLAIDAQTPSNSIDQTRHLSTRSVQQPIVVGHNKSQNDSRVLGMHTENSRQNSEIPILPIYQPSRKQHTTVHANGYQNLCTQKQLVNQSTQMNSKPKRVNYMDDGARSSVTGSHLNVMENASQRDEYIVKESRTPYHVPSDSDAVRDHEEVSNRDRAADESPVKTTDNVYGTAKDLSHDSADKPIADKNSTSTNHQTHSKFILEQQMLDNIDILFTEILSTVRHMTDMYWTLHSLNLDIAEKYKKLLGSVEQFKTAANDPRHDSADRPTADQNSTSTNHQTHSRFIFSEREQQMLDNFAILFIEMRYTFRHTTDMYHTLRSSILDITETYRKFLGSVEQFNTAAGNTASSASPSSNLTREGSRSPEETHTEVTASASSSYQDQHRIDVAYKELYRFVLPPEYDADDTRWTLKYRTNLPGLVELMPQSGVYVSSGDLNHCKHVSKDCKSLAVTLLPEVFSRNALSVCLSMTETRQAYNNKCLLCRPELDKHACSILLNFVCEHGIRRGWNTDLEPILRILHCKTQEIRFKYGVLVKC